MPIHDILCLANSKKHGGRCVAGLRLDGGGWIRPVSFQRNGTLFERHFTLTDGSIAQPLDVLRIRFATPSPEPHHPENVLLTHTPWELIARPACSAALPALRKALVRGPALLGNTADRVPFTQFAISPAKASLAVFIPNEFRWVVRNSRQGELQLRVRFTIQDAGYTLPLTDMYWKQRCASLAIGEHDRSKVGLQPDDALLLTVSLSEPYKPDEMSAEYTYKLVAAVTVVPTEWRATLEFPTNTVLSGRKRDCSEEAEPYDWSWLGSSVKEQRRDDNKD